MRHARTTGGFPTVLRWVFAHLVAFVEATAFWVAATSPFAHIAAYLLYVRDAVSGTALLGLVALNAVAIVIGHHHDRKIE